MIFPRKARLVEPLGLRMAHGPLPAPLMRLLLLSVEARGCPCYLVSVSDG